MITLITTTIPEVEKYFDYFKKSLIKHFKLVKEIIICKANMPSSYFNQWEESNIKFIEIGSLYSEYRKSNKLDISHDHIMALQQAIDYSNNEFLFMSDVDIFFNSSVDSIYYDLMNQHELDLIGITRSNPNWYVHGFFPTVINMLVRKSKLPTEEFAQQFGVKNWLWFELNWRSNPPNNFEKLFTKPNGHYDTGCLLYPWAMQNNLRWLSFQTADLHNYSTKYFASKPKIKNLPNSKLLYHQSRSIFDSAFQEYKTAMELK